MGLEDVRARLKDRQVKDGALGTTDTTVCLDLTLIEELEELQTQLAAAQTAQTAAEPAGKARLGGTAAAKRKDDSTVDDLEAKLAAKEQEVRNASLRLVFRSVGSSRYQELINASPDIDSNEGRADFFNDLAGACLYQAFEAGSTENLVTQGLRWSEIAPEISFGEWDDTTTKVYALNRRKVDVPFSLRP